MKASVSVDSYTLLQIIHSGIKSIERHPCSVCSTQAGPGIPRTHFHGSDWGKCYRMVNLEMMIGKKEELTDDKRFFLRDGHLHEKSIVTALRWGGCEVTGAADGEDETTYDCSIPTPSGLVNISTILHTDGIIAGFNAGIECKSVKDTAFKKFEKGIIPTNYYGQCQIYMLKHRLKRWFLIVKSRHSSRVLPPFEIAFDPEYIKLKATHLAAVKVALETGNVLKVPPDKIGRRDSECMWCQFKENCWTK